MRRRHLLAASTSLLAARTLDAAAAGDIGPAAAGDIGRAAAATSRSAADSARAPTTARRPADAPGASATAEPSAEARVQRFLRRVATIDRGGPALRSVIEVNPQALEIARALDAERRGGRVRGPLHGKPVLVKDNIATGDRMSTSVGSLALDGMRAARDAHVVGRLREAGMVVVGKTNLSEWANIRSLRGTSGWSARGGLTRHPYALDRSPSGSSSGAAVAVAADLVRFSVGTETDGSIVSPSSICGVVGLKPTVGRVSRDGIAPISRTQDSAGPIAPTVADCAALFAAMGGRDERDPATLRAPGAADATTAPLASAAGVERAGATFAGADALRGARLGVARAYLTGLAAADALFEAALARLRSLGAELVDPIDLPQPTYWDAELTVLLHEMKADLPAWLAAFAPQSPLRSLADVIAFNRANAAREMAWFGQDLFERADKLGGLDSPEYVKALADCAAAARTDGLDRVLGEQRLDAVVAPTGGLAWLVDPIAGDHGGISFSTPAAVAGYPHLTVPAGYAHGLPFGLSFVGPAWSEWRLLSYGHAYEQATLHRRPATFRERSVPALTAT